MKRARRRPYVSLLPRKPGSSFLHWDLGSSFSTSLSHIEIQVGYFSLTPPNHFVVLKTIGPPKLRGTTFVHTDSEAKHPPLVALITQHLPPYKSSLHLSPADIYATSRPIELLRTESGELPVRFVSIKFEAGKPLTLSALDDHIILPQKITLEAPFDSSSCTPSSFERP